VVKSDHFGGVRGRKRPLAGPNPPFGALLANFGHFLAHLACFWHLLTTLGGPAPSGGTLGSILTPGGQIWGRFDPSGGDLGSILTPGGQIWGRFDPSGGDLGVVLTP